MGLLQDYLRSIFTLFLRKYVQYSIKDELDLFEEKF
jgi:hypothetical protein